MHIFGYSMTELHCSCCSKGIGFAAVSVVKSEECFLSSTQGDVSMTNTPCMHLQGAYVAHGLLRDEGST